MLWRVIALSIYVPFFDGGVPSCPCVGLVHFPHLFKSCGRVALRGLPAGANANPTHGK